MGNCQVTIQSLRVVKVDTANNLLLVKGGVPGKNNSYLVIRKSSRKKPAAQTPKAAAAGAAKPGVVRPAAARKK
jgi:large subunit ribosomal protein L3